MVKRQNRIQRVATRTPTDQWTSDTRNKLVHKVNHAEVHVMSLLKKCGVLYDRERPFLIDGKRFFVDFLVTSIMTDKRRKIRVAIEVDGGYHFTEEQRIKDRAKDRQLLKSSRVWSVLRISSDVAMRMTSEELRATIISNKVGVATRIYSDAERLLLR